MKKLTVLLATACLLAGVVALPAIAVEPPDCSQAYPSVATLWPPDHQFVAIDVLGVTDPDGDELMITIEDIYQDEPLNTYGDGRFTPDGMGIGTPTAQLRAERSGTPKVPGDGRFYHVSFTATDWAGNSCWAVVLVAVPHDMTHAPVDDGPLYDSTASP